jgi:uncharacterized protein (UPF0335 family)
MAKRARPGDSESGGVTNLTETKAVIKESVAQILRLKTQRKEINAAIGEHRAHVKKYGVPTGALDLAIRMKEADVEDRQAMDEGYIIAREALGLGIQRSLFEMLDTRKADEEVIAKSRENPSHKPVDHPEDSSDLAEAGRLSADEQERGSLVPDAV